MLHTVIDVLGKQVGGAISTSGKGKTEVFFDPREFLQRNPAANP